MSTAVDATHRFTRRVMGTVASVHVHDEVDVDRAAMAVDAVWAELERWEAMFSTFRPESEISRVNRGELDLLACSPEVFEVLDACTWLEHASEGAFTIRPDGPGGRIDPAGFVKGWAAERAAARLDQHGLGNWYLSVGGDLLVRGHPRHSDTWTIAIADPRGGERPAAAVQITEGAVATSGTAERGHHLWDAAGRVVDVHASVTVLGPSLAWADAFATTACALGDAGVEWVCRFPGYRAFAIGHDGRLINTIER